MKFDTKIILTGLILLFIFIVIFNNGINWPEFLELTVLLIMLLWILDIKIPIEIPGVIKIGEQLKDIGERLINISQNISNIKIINENIGEKFEESYTFTTQADNVSSDIAETQLTSTNEKIKK